MGGKEQTHFQGHAVPFPTVNTLIGRHLADVAWHHYPLHLAVDSAWHALGAKVQMLQVLVVLVQFLPRRMQSSLAPVAAELR